MMNFTILKDSNEIKDNQNSDEPQRKKLCIKRNWHHKSRGHIAKVYDLNHWLKLDKYIFSEKRISPGSEINKKMELYYWFHKEHVHDHGSTSQRFKSLTWLGM